MTEEAGPTPPTPKPPTRYGRDSQVLTGVVAVVLGSYIAVKFGVSIDVVKEVGVPALTLLGVAYKGEGDQS